MGRSYDELLDKILTNEEVFSLKHNQFKDEVEIMHSNINQNINHSITSAVSNLDNNLK